jgi:hypothetical protein
MDSKETKIVDISKYSKNNPLEVDLEQEVEELIAHGLEVFNEDLKNSSGFLAITIDEGGTPSIVWAGNVDTITTLGSIEIAKQLFIEKTFT